jgi:hypothetical protein
LRRELARIPVREPLRPSLAAVTSGGGGNGGSSGCCCNEADCVDLCTAIDSDVVTNCTACPSGAVKNYDAFIGISAAFPALRDDAVTGRTRLTWSHECDWRNAGFTIDGGLYQAAIVMAARPYIEIQHISGPDPLKVTDGYHRIRWNYTGSNAEYSCLCNMQFKLDVSKVYKPKGLNQLICLQPVQLGELPITCPKVINPETDEYVIPCLEFFSFPELAVTEICGYSGSTAVELNLGYYLDIERQCVRVGSAVLRAESSPGANDQVTVGVDIWYAGETVTLTLICPAHAYYMVYTSPTEWVIGENVLTRVGDDDIYPEHVSVFLTDCVFGSTHPDTGYGCGGAHGTGDCGGSCFWLTLNNEDEASGPGPYRWIASGGVGTACAQCGGCPEPDTEPTEGASATTYCEGA